MSSRNLTNGIISSQLSDAVVFSVLIIVLLVRPTGITGQEDYRESVGGEIEKYERLKQNSHHYCMVIAFWAVIPES